MQPEFTLEFDTERFTPEEARAIFDDVLRQSRSGASFLMVPEGVRITTITPVKVLVTRGAAPFGLPQVKQAVAPEPVPGARRIVLDE